MPQPKTTAMPTRPGTDTPAASERLTGVGRVLLAYFSRPGENYHDGGRIDLKVGNTQVVAEMIAAIADVDVYRIEAADPYPENYEGTVVRNVREEASDARPAIANPLPSLAGHDTILLGSPIWNVQEPMIMRTFLENIDVTGATIHPFVTYAVSGIGRVERNYTRLCPQATMGEPLTIRGEEATTARPQVEAWLGRMGLL